MRGDAGESHRLIDAMPRPLLALFAVFCLAALVTVVVLLIRPPRSDTVPLERRRPPPRATFSHDVGAVLAPALPSAVPPATLPCPAVRGIRVLGGPDFVGRMEAVLGQACLLAGEGVEPVLGESIAGLRGATVRVARFRATGVDSTADFSTKTIWLNVRLSRRDLPPSHAVPALLHDAWHLSRPDREITAREELAARRVEAAACRQLVPIDDWPRWCEDARALTDLPETSAVELLVTAGYAR